MAKSWDCLFEIEKYWDIVVASEKLTSNYHKELKEDLTYFNIEKFSPVADIGAGAFGGVLSYLDFGLPKYIIDPCATLFKNKYNQISNDIILIDSYSYNIPLVQDSLRTIFCIETLDHCNSIEEYKKSTEEMARVLCPGGTLYFMIPLREKKKTGHFICLETISFEDIKMGFKHLEIIESIVKDKTEVEMNRHLYMTLRKPL
ncbi:MAG: methyltransferase domain-containing protein [Clostridia bacterium]|jgi:hypothetical protein